MFEELLEEFEDTIEQASIEVMKYIQKRCVEEFKHAVLLSVYSVYAPTWWKRTEQLLGAISSECVFSGGKVSLEVYVDAEKLKYNSWTYAGETNRDVSVAVPFWVESGHHSKRINSTLNEYDDYDGRHYLEMAKELIENDLRNDGLNVNIKIINEKPPRV